MNPRCSTCKYRFTYEKCAKCYSQDNYEQGDGLLHFLSKEEPSEVCTYHILGKEGCKNCKYKLKCMLLKGD